MSQLISSIRSAAATIFALALVCAGQTSSITVTLAGQIVSEGFIEWKISVCSSELLCLGGTPMRQERRMFHANELLLQPFLRRLITRSISLVPSMVVSIAVGRGGINDLLVASQVVLSVVLPFVAFPLIYLTSMEVVMRVRKPVESVTDSEETSSDSNEETQRADEVLEDINAVKVAEKGQCEIASEETVDFSNGRVLMTLSYAIWCVVLVANAYAIVMLIIGVT